MSRALKTFAACALSLVFYLPMHGQDSPSLGDLARQAQKDKTSAPAAKVITNDDISSSQGAGFSGRGRVVQPGGSGKQGAPVSATDELQKMELLLTQLDSEDRETLAKSVLEGVDANFPGREKWEQELFVAKQTFVSQERNLMKKAQQLEGTANGVQDIQNQNDPRAKDLKNRLQQLIQESSAIDAAFQAVIKEGRDLAGQSLSH